jgi:hypothetical protein
VSVFPRLKAKIRDFCERDTNFAGHPRLLAVSIYLPQFVPIGTGNPLSIPPRPAHHTSTTNRRHNLRIASIPTYRPIPRLSAIHPHPLYDISLHPRITQLYWTLYPLSQSVHPSKSELLRLLLSRMLPFCQSGYPHLRPTNACCTGSRIVCRSAVRYLPYDELARCALWNAVANPATADPLPPPGSIGDSFDDDTGEAGAVAFPADDVEETEETLRLPE